jgi:hypothetical protein
MFSIICDICPTHIILLHSIILTMLGKHTNKNYKNVENTREISIPVWFAQLVLSVYMDVDRITGPLRLNMLTMRGDIPRSFRIKVTQIKKGSPLEAPKNCLQYHTGIHGSIESFNYQMPKRSNLPARPGYMVSHNLRANKCHRHGTELYKQYLTHVKKINKSEIYECVFFVWLV